MYTEYKWIEIFYNLKKFGTCLNLFYFSFLDFKHSEKYIDFIVTYFFFFINVYTFWLI